MAASTIFISYARADSDVANRLKADLRMAGVTIWIDHESLQPGAPDWQAAVRRGIAAADTVIYLGSPDAAQSPNVGSEVLIALEERRSIVPVWARGEQWSKSAPFELIRANYLDARGPSYPAALNRLLSALGLGPASLPSQPWPLLPAQQAHATPRSAPAASQPAAPGPTGALRLVEKLKIEVDSSVWRLAWSPDGALLAACVNDGAVSVWDPVSGHLRRSIKGHPAAVSNVAWAPDGARLASASADKTVRIWNPLTGQPLTTFQGHESQINCVAWSPDGALLASGGGAVWLTLVMVYGDTVIRIWRPDGVLQRSLVGHTEQVTCVAWSPDSSRLASASLDRSVRIWGVDPSDTPTTLKGHSESVLSVAWSPDGGRLASASSDKTIRLWDPASGRLFTTLKGHREAVRYIAWRPNGACLASASDDKTIHLWDPISGRLLESVKSQAYVTGLTWSPDGARFAASGSDKAILIWEIVAN
jgi:dipeptidyl aminopeptidase/acylaminoacyl peptidase